MIIRVQTVGPRASEAPGLQRGPVCPVTRKVMFDSEELALAAAWTRRRFRLGKPYRCECGAWHLTSRR